MSEKTRAFVQHAFALGVAETLNERKRWLIARYVANDELTIDELRSYVGVKNIRSVWELYTGSLKTLWETMPDEIQRKFPKDETLKGKRTGPKCGPQKWRVYLSEAERKKRKADYQRRYNMRLKEQREK